MKELEVAGFGTDTSSGNPEILLRTLDGSIEFSVWIGAVEAADISLVLTQTPTRRPLAHELLLNVIAVWDRQLTMVEISDVREDIFYASLVFDDGNRVSCRPSDGIALALRAQVPIALAESVESFLVQEQGTSSTAPQANELDEFRKFLDSISPDDFV